MFPRGPSVRNLLIFILVLIVIWWVRRALHRPTGGAGASGARSRARDEALDGPERMLACAHCGVHVPESEGVLEGEVFFCSEDHRRLGVRR
jgi:uncharacterized protein